ncbi:centrosomal protein of 152 kDa isoform X2 [Cololabis saira]|uniref:centrosomal protein of 152 kDa isoform X2 n=1 Tax=Cololabis saira TaxID=129043 RepID=UPI002AD1D76F|nr:centrosomal protein of 152 kDa isoform X2 [Cololabis saira]
MGPLVVEAVEDLRTIQRSLWELHQLLTDLPDDMLEDSRDSSSPELECSTCSNKNTGSSPQSKWTNQWPDHGGPTSHAQNYEEDYDQGIHHEYVPEDGDAGPQAQPRPHTWDRDQFVRDGYTGTGKCVETSDFSADFDSEPYPESAAHHTGHDGDGGYEREQRNGGQDTRNAFQNLHSGPQDRGVNPYQAHYHPHHPAPLPQAFSSQAGQQTDPFEHLQREFLDSAQQTADKERLAQLQILNKAQQRQIEDLERKLEDSRRNMRYLEHQFAIVKDEKDGLALSLKESSQLIEEAKEREVQMQNKLKAMEQQVQTLCQRDQENMKKQRVADAAVDAMKQQMLELRRSDILSRAREQHDRDLAVIKEQHDAALLGLQQKLDATSQSLSEQIGVGEKLREHVKLLEHQREEEQLERARIVNALSQRLEETQQQCAKMLHTNSAQAMAEMEIKLQQTQSARALGESMNSVLQEDMADLKEQITLYESAVKNGVIALDHSSDWENHLSDSCVDLGLKTHRKNGRLQSPALAHLPESRLPKEEAVRLLRLEMQRCLGCLKGKRQKISRLQEQLQQLQTRLDEQQIQLDEARLNNSSKEMSQKHLDLTVDSHKELKRLQEDKQHLQEQAELLEKKNKELKQNEEKLRSANSELCSKMREMIQELDQEKQEAAQRSERINQQYRDDVVKRVRTELALEHDAQVQQLTALHQQQVQQLTNQLSEISDKMLAVQECYISVCKEKSLLEEKVSRETEEAAMDGGSSTAAERLRSELEAQHQAAIKQLRAVWSTEKETELQHQVTSRVASVEDQWKEKLMETEKTWAQRVEEAKKERQRETVEATCQIDETEAGRRSISAEELESRLSAQKQQLQLEADKVRSKAVEEARKLLQRELQEKHLEDMGRQVEGAVTRAYNRWVEDLSSLPEYQSSLQTEREKWEELQEELVQQRVSRALEEAEEQWDKKHNRQLRERSSGAPGVEELQEELVALKSQSERASKEQAALLKAELTAARAAWNREKQQEISVLQVRREQAHQSKLQEQRKELEQAVQQARDDAALQRTELLLQVEAREEEWRRQHAEREPAQSRQLRDGFVAELRSALADVHAQLLRAPENGRRASGSTSEATVTHIIHNSCRDLVSRAVAEASRDWEEMSQEKLRRVLKETVEQHEKEINKMQSSSSQRTEPSRCRKECTVTVSKLQKKNQDLQRHLEKACRQLQHSIREHKTTMQHLKDEHESSLRKAEEQHLQQLEEVKRTKETSSCEQQKLRQGLEEMKQQYLTTVENIRGDMLRYLQESRERAAETIRMEVQRERQDTARKMRRYYLTCLQELLEDGGKITGAEKKIMNAASKLAAMAKVLETPFKSKSGKSCASRSCPTTVSTAATGGPPGGDAAVRRVLSALTGPPGSRPGETSADSRQKPAVAVGTKPLSHRDSPASQEILGESSHIPTPPHKPSLHASQPHRDLISVSGTGNRKELHLRGRDPSRAGGKALVVQEAPVRDQNRPDWTTSSCDSDTGQRRVEPARPFSVSAGEFGSLVTDGSDPTAHNQVPMKWAQTGSFPGAHREPTPGSECESRQRVCPRPLFSELRQRQQDSGFDSPFLQQK